jgi:hypothetical protein
MKCVYYFLLSVIVQGCVTTQSDKTNKLLGEWRGEQAGNTVSLPSLGEGSAFRPAVCQIPFGKNRPKSHVGQCSCLAFPFVK